MINTLVRNTKTKWGTFFKFFWPSQNIWTIHHHGSSQSKLSTILASGQLHVFEKRRKNGSYQLSKDFEIFWANPKITHNSTYFSSRWYNKSGQSFEMWLRWRHRRQKEVKTKHGCGLNCWAATPIWQKKSSRWTVFLQKKPKKVWRRNHDWQKQCNRQQLISLFVFERPPPCGMVLFSV